MRLALRLNGIFYDRLSLRNGGLAQAADIFRFGLGRLKSSRISMPVFRRRRLVDSIPRLDLNRLSDAVKFSPAGSVVELTLRQTERGVQVSVQDEGPGMDKSTQSHIFDQFYQGDTSHKTEGNGLGLAMVKKIVALHGGSVTVKSIPGQGSTFEVTLSVIK